MPITTSIHHHGHSETLEGTTWTFGDYRQKTIKIIPDVGIHAGMPWGFVGVPSPETWPQPVTGTRFRVLSRDSGTITIELIDEARQTSIKGDQIMNGTVYEGIVVQTDKVVAGPGLTSHIEVSKVVHVSANFVAASDAVATGIVLAEAVKKGVDINDPKSPVEVKLRKW